MYACVCVYHVLMRIYAKKYLEISTPIQFSVVFSTWGRRFATKIWTVCPTGQGGGFEHFTAVVVGTTWMVEQYPFGLFSISQQFSVEGYN